jgi:hypothetical protein
LQWRRDIPIVPGPFALRGPKVYPDIDACRPVQLGKTLFVPVAASDCLLACDTATGELRWRFFASGAVRRPPAALALPDGKGAVILGSDDGWVYGLNAADGSVRWRFSAAPDNRRVMGFGRLSSAWPVWASPVLHDGKVYFAAGMLPSLGLVAYCLDAATGAVVWRNDGRIFDVFNTSALGPLAMATNHASLYGSTEGPSSPWVLDAATGEFKGHLNVGFGFSGGAKALRDGRFGWYVNGSGAFNVPEPMSIKAGAQTFDARSVAGLGVTGTVSSLLAGDDRLFVTTAEGGVYCFAGTSAAPKIHALSRTPLAEKNDVWSAAATAMLGRNDLKQGLALVLGLGHGAESGRLVEELARQSSLMVVAVDPDRARLQALRLRLEAAGCSGARVSTLEGNPFDFHFAPGQAALIASEDLASCVWPPDDAAGARWVQRLYSWTRPFGGEVWLPTTKQHDADIARWACRPSRLPLSTLARRSDVPAATGGFTQLRRTGLPDDPDWLRPPLTVAAFGVLTSSYTAPPEVGNFARTFMTRKALGLDEASARSHVVDSRDIYSWLPLAEPGPGTEPVPPQFNNATEPKGMPKWVSAALKEATRVNPLYGTRERFGALPCSGYDSCCIGTVRYRDCWLNGGKMASIGSVSPSNSWGRLVLVDGGGCSGHVSARDGVFLLTPADSPGCYCGCVAAMQFTQIAWEPGDDRDENWVLYQGARTVEPVEERPILRVGINFGAPGDRFVPESGTLWTHHPFAGRYGRRSAALVTAEELPLVPVTYRGKVRAVYHHSARMERIEGALPWVSASCVEGMSEIAVPVAQPAVAVRAAAPPLLDGRLDDACWDERHRLAIVANTLLLDPARAQGLPRPDDQCHARIRYDDRNLYIGAGVHAPYGPESAGGLAPARKYLAVYLKNRGATTGIALTCGEAIRKSEKMDSNAWSCACTTNGTESFTAEIAVPWNAMEAAGLRRDRLLVNLDLSGSVLTGEYAVPAANGDLSRLRPSPQYTPLFFDTAQGAMAGERPYTVRLFFAEMEGAGPGNRVFDVSLQGRTVLQKLDVVREAGGPGRELVKEFRAIRIAGSLAIGFAARVGEPMLSGVELVAETAGDLPQTGAAKE